MVRNCGVRGGRERLAGLKGAAEEELNARNEEAGLSIPEGAAHSAPELLFWRRRWR